ncbi:MAG: MscL family protein, partial [Bacilli bacterium]|nr:MscL family protein [Bacilli bacterium]
MKKLIKEFTDFMNQGNFLEIAVGLLIAASFKDLVTSFSDSFIMPIVAKLLGSLHGSNAFFEIAGMKF